MEKYFHILLLEANSPHKEWLEKALHEDHLITTAQSLDECWDVMRNNIHDTLILDLDLCSQSSGLGFLQKLVESHPYLPVIVTTSFGNEELAVKVLKSGAKDYLSKAHNQDFLSKIKKTITEIMEEKTEKKDEYDEIIRFILMNIESFLQIWKKQILLMGNQIGSREKQVIKKDELKFFFRAYLQDINNEKGHESLILLKRMIWEKKSDDKYVLRAELLNISFKESMREFIMKHYSYFKDYKKDLMKRVGVIVDENNLSLSKEYEKVLGQSLNRIRTDERLATKYILLRTLQHEIRQPLSYIQNSAEILLTGECEDFRDKYIKNILEQAQKIEDLLIKLEDDSQMLLTNYSDDLLMVDVSREGE